MAENYSFFNSKDRDRVYNARHWADYFFPLFKSGVFNGDLQVVANRGMTVKIKSGYAWIDGYSYHLTDELVVDLENASGNMNRKDNIVICLDLTNRWIKGFCKTGSYFSKEAIPPEREKTATIHELVIARINIKAGTTEITQEMIEDTRMDDSLCGWVCGTVDQIKFEQIYTQFEAFQAAKVDAIHKWIDKFQEDTEKELSDWFNNLREQLTDNQAINLQEQIGRLPELNTINKNNIVDAINEVKGNIKTPIKSLLATKEGYSLDSTVGKFLDDKIEQINSNLPFALGVDADGRYGYIKAGADTVTPFLVHGEVTIYTARTNKLVFETGHPGYDNFVACIKKDFTIYTGKGSIDYYSIWFRTEYDKNTGRITITGAGNEPAFASFQWSRNFTLEYALW